MCKDGSYIRSMFQNYEKVRKSINERVNYVVMFSSGSLNHESTWLMSTKELEENEETLNEFIKLTMASKLI